MHKQLRMPCGPSGTARRVRWPLLTRMCGDVYVCVFAITLPLKVKVVRKTNEYEIYSAYYTTRRQRLHETLSGVQCIMLYSVCIATRLV